MACDDETLKDIHVEPEKALEDTHAVSTMCCVDKAMEDTHVVHDKALEDSHVASEKRIEVMEEMPKNEGQQESQIQNKRKIINPELIRRKKIFVGGLPSGISEEEFKNYFERFGTITDVVVMQHSATHRPRGFGFITFDSEKSVEDVMVNTFHDLNGKQVEVKRVVPKEENNGAFDQLKSNYEKGTSLENFPYYGTNIIPTPAYGPFPWYQNNGLYFHAPNPYGWYPMLGASFPWYMPMVSMSQPCPQPFGYCFPSYPYLVGMLG